ncbi:D-alanine--poly(phosphoribitol) ligase subunit DltC [Secundilactobacillus folii]|uniref:D-alanyl carrier protein n=1 Tax=Secundilactobacillus folii TaxID=2678357 RepID=A0A7X3C1Z3_9LACO|nr:D-alanine--poly(phosphoribitol) ligase subunit DltC [Secundilactobacillus folii]MTV82290.1 D-alanine--poly(phosphoribitol) ligase subunit DltC [Secundilactobacillus folii]
MNNEKKILQILNELTGTDVSNKRDDNLFETGLMDSMASVQLVVDLEEACHVTIPISEFDRNEWDTANKIIQKVATLQ